MRRLFLILSILFIALSPSYIQAWDSEEKKENEEEQAIIIEVEGNPHEHKKFLNIYHPSVDVVSVYDTLFEGLAIKASPDVLSRLSSLEFVRAIHPSVSYKTNEVKALDSPPVLSADDIEDTEQIVLPETLNDTEYTGKGIKVGVIDTGIDYTHPDLETNYRGGYDLVDLDEDPMETLPEQGIPTQHGSHVAGIIAGNGFLTGVAPDSEVYAYRALGPGGMGSSVQIIAAMEQAVKDGMDIINLSLGNDINGPDYPTSVAVNKATDLGISVVIANGNSGPNDWTVGSPATASKALSIGAAEQSKQIPYLSEAMSDRKLHIKPFMGSVPWKLTKDYAVATENEDFTGKIALVKRGEIPFYEIAKNAQKQGAEAVLIYNHEEEDFQGSIVGEEQVTIPVAQLSKKDGEWLARQSNEKTLYLDTEYEEKISGVADFSSRGPVTVNWDIKPDILAPGTDILSTVPGGYQVLQGTSMAAPHASGVIALIKEAKPDWSNEQIIGALKTSANQMISDEGELLEPIVQGTGMVQPKKAVETSTIIHDPTLSFGEVDNKNRKKTAELTIENTTNESKTFSFKIPKNKKGISWNLPQTFTLGKREKKTIQVDIDVNPQLLEEGTHQGWLTLEGNGQTYQLPYLFISEVADNPKAMGFGFALKPLAEDKFQYQIYLTEQAKSVDINLYNPDTLMYEQHFLRLDEPQMGLNEGEMAKTDLGKPGVYKALITVELENGEYESHETMIVIEP